MEDKILFHWVKVVKTDELSKIKTWVQNTEGVLSEAWKVPPQYFYQKDDQNQFILCQLLPSLTNCTLLPAVIVGLAVLLAMRYVLVTITELAE
jgi:hypothetical protein